MIKKSGAFQLQTQVKLTLDSIITKSIDNERVCQDLLYM